MQTTRVLVRANADVTIILGRAVRALMARPPLGVRARSRPSAHRPGAAPAAAIDAPSRPAAPADPTPHPSSLVAWARPQHRDVAFIDGTCMAIAATTYARVGPLDAASFGRFGWGAELDCLTCLRT